MLSIDRLKFYPEKSLKQRPATRKILINKSTNQHVYSSIWNILSKKEAQVVAYLFDYCRWLEYNNSVINYIYCKYYNNFHYNPYY